jgi:hypothetical protein
MSRDTSSRNENEPENTRFHLGRNGNARTFNFGKLKISPLHDRHNTKRVRSKTGGVE